MHRDDHTAPTVQRATFAAAKRAASRDGSTLTDDCVSVALGCSEATARRMREGAAPMGLQDLAELARVSGDAPAVIGAWMASEGMGRLTDDGLTDAERCQFHGQQSAAFLGWLIAASADGRITPDEIRQVPLAPEDLRRMADCIEAARSQGGREVTRG